MIIPKKLKPGDTVGLICPSSPIKTERIEQCRAVVERLGYRVKLADNLDTNYAGFMAGDGSVRAKWINQMFADPEVDAIFCIRGGFSASRTIPYLDLDLIKSNPKIFLGYSDVTCLHAVLNKFCNLMTYHGPMVSSNMVDDLDEYSRDCLFRCLNAVDTYELKNPAGESLITIKEGRAEGPLVGGNLALLSATMGTPYEVDTKGKIFFIEEVDEQMMQIERYLAHLDQCGKFEDAAGIIIGDFTDCGNRYDSSYDHLCAFSDHLKKRNQPVIANLKAGHGFPTATLPLGAVCVLDTSKEAILFHMK